MLRPGMLIGEQIVPVVKQWVAGRPLTMQWFRTECVPKITGTPAIVSEKGETKKTRLPKNMSNT